MPTILTRAGKGSELTHNELDANFKRTVTAKTDTYQVLVADNRSVIECNKATAFTVTMVAVAGAAAEDTGDFETTFTNIGAGVVTIDGSGAETIDGTTSIALNKWDSITIKLNSAGTAWKSVSRAGYEEGTFTPTIQDDTFSDAESQTTDIQTGEYTRIGNLVTFILHIRVTSLGTLTGANAAHIGNLPFTVGSLTGGAFCAFSNGISIPSESSITGTCVPATTYINLNKWSGTAGTLAMLVSEVSATGQIQLFGHYYV